MAKSGVVFDIAGPLRDSSKQMHEGFKLAAEREGVSALHKALSEADPFHTWQLFGLTQNFSKAKLAVVWERAKEEPFSWGKDFVAFMFAFAGLWEAGRLSEVLTASKDPEGDVEKAIIDTIRKGGAIVPLGVLARVGVLSKTLFKEGATLRYTRLSPGAVASLEMVKNAMAEGKAVPPAIITSAPEGSTEKWLNATLYQHASIKGIFPPSLIVEGAVDKAQAFIDVLERIVKDYRSAKLAYIADTSSDIVALDKAMERDSRVRETYLLYLTRFGMGVEASWERALAGAKHLKKGVNVFVVDNAFDAVKAFLGGA